MNSLAKIEAALARHRDLLMSYAGANLKISELCTALDRPEMVYSAMQLSIYDHQLFHLTAFDNNETNYILYRFAQEIGVHKGIEETFKIAFVPEEEPSEELQAQTAQFLEFVKENPFDFSVAHWEEQMCELIEAAGETSEFDEEEMDFHESEPMPEPKIATPAAVPPAASSTAPVKRPCNNWLASGKCQFGDKCRFSHEPVAVVAGGGAALKETCRVWAAGGQCQFGVKCRYSHAVPS
jgi:hypothetical protein